MWENELESGGEKGERKKSDWLILSTFKIKQQIKWKFYQFVVRWWANNSEDKTFFLAEFVFYSSNDSSDFSFFSLLLLWLLLLFSSVFAFEFEETPLPRASDFLALEFESPVMQPHSGSDLSSSSFCAVCICCFGCCGWWLPIGVELEEPALKLKINQCKRKLISYIIMMSMSWFTDDWRLPG